ncbi:GNAT family N-acetyltransferase [Georgenia sp. TF02-10]|nr:GNAT family N-acetyltransferase [Georgenia sp. TF02-10]
MAGVLSDVSLYRFTGGEPPSEEELVRRYSSQVRGFSPDGSDVWINYIVVLDAEPIGYVQAAIPVGGDVAEVAWVIGRPWQGNGYARRAAQILVEELDRRGVRVVMAHIHPNHTASQCIAEGLGMAPTGDIVDGEMRWVGDVRAPR